MGHTPVTMARLLGAETLALEVTQAELNSIQFHPALTRYNQVCSGLTTAANERAQLAAHQEAQLHDAQVQSLTNRVQVANMCAHHRGEFMWQHHGISADGSWSRLAEQQWAASAGKLHMQQLQQTRALEGKLHMQQLQQTRALEEQLHMQQLQQTRALEVSNSIHKTCIKQERNELLRLQHGLPPVVPLQHTAAAFPMNHTVTRYGRM